MHPVSYKASMYDIFRYVVELPCHSNLKGMLPCVLSLTFKVGVEQPTHLANQDDGITGHGNTMQWRLHIEFIWTYDLYVCVVEIT